ncbi:chaperone NapD [Aliiroseovarius sp. S2029]|uniref:chaperone NapD n=1 Tax=Aliiroseovarius sp. S2029 TaxID=2936988 RepID=UPI0020BDAAE9|nr:chaperone NapD [Aliiroseovarius sp. S2029]MCK8482784.1 chaperone NapD [Aliiroseovarius sp. S2029]
MTNICGCLVHTMPEMTEQVIAAIDATEGGEVHAHEDGRIVVTVEDTPDMRASDQIMAMHQIPGVLTITLTYHHFEELDGTPAAPSTTQHH